MCVAAAEDIEDQGEEGAPHGDEDGAAGGGAVAGVICGGEDVFGDVGAAALIDESGPFGGLGEDVRFEGPAGGEDHGEAVRGWRHFVKRFDAATEEDHEEQWDGEKCDGGFGGFGDG